MDALSPAHRSWNMSRIRGRNTAPELKVRSALHRAGFRFRLHRKNLPGTPDIVLPRFRTVIFVHGCFWHGHDCYVFKMPSTNSEFWKIKINTNKSNDLKNYDLLLVSGWRVITIWECAIKGKLRLDFNTLISSVCDFLKNDSATASCEFRHL